jgi:hypothetical protein
LRVCWRAPHARSHKREQRDNPQARWVEAFAQAWRAPVDGDALFDRIRPHLRADYQFRQPLTRGAGVGLAQFRQPLTRGAGVGLAQFRRRFVQPLLHLMTDMNGTVESWAANGETVFIELTLDGRVGRRRVCLRACDRVTLADGLATDRRTYVDPLPLIAAVLRTPRLWVSVLRWQLDEAMGRRAT